MDVASFFSRLVRPAPIKHDDPATPVRIAAVKDFEAVWRQVQTVLREPDQRQLLRGIGESTVPRNLDALLQALVAETEEHVVETASESHTGPFTEYFLNHSVYATLVELCLPDKPFGIQSLVVHFSNQLLRTIPNHLLLHSTIIQPLCQLLRHSSVDHQSFVLDHDDGTRPAPGPDSHVGDTTLRLEGTHNEELLEGRVLDLWLQLWNRIENEPQLLLVAFPFHMQQRPETVAQPSVPLDLDLIAIEFLTRFLHDGEEKGNIARTTIRSMLRIVFYADSDAGSNSNMGSRAEVATRISIAKHLMGQSTNFVQVLVAGLGAIYSVLPTKVRLESSAEIASRNPAGTMQLGFEAEDPVNPAPPMEGTLPKRLFDPEVQAQLNLLLDLIAFTDDVLSASEYQGPESDLVTIASDLRTAIETTIRTSFIDNVLYPALLESSADDGSATAIAAYLTCIVEDEVNRQLSVGTIVVQHLVGLSLSDGVERVQYTIRDFTADLFAHGSSDSVVAASTLLCALTRRYCSVTSGSLFAQPAQVSTGFAADVEKVKARRLDNLVASTLRYDTADPSGASQYMASEILPVALAVTPRSSIYSAPGIKPYLTILRQLLPPRDGDDTAGIVDRQMQESYDGDAFARMSCHSCLVDGLRQLDGRESAQREHPHLAIEPNGLLMNAIQARLRNFFTSSPFANLELCRVICDIALCPMTSIDGWLISNKKDAKVDQVVSDQDEVDMLDNPFVERKKQTSSARVIDTLRQLVNDVDAFRGSFSEFDQYLTERRQGLMSGSESQEGEIHTSEAGTTDQGLGDDLALTPSKSRRPGMMTTLTSFLTPRKHSDTSKIGTSPADHMGTPTEVHYRQTTPVLLDTAVHRIPEASGSPYSMSKRNRRVIHRSLLSDTASTASSEVYTTTSSHGGNGVQPVSLSNVLDNVVVLEAFVREVVAVLVVRRSLGIDEPSIV